MLPPIDDDSIDARTPFFSEFRCCGRRIKIFRAWLVLALVLAAAAFSLFVWAVVKADEDSGRAITWEWIPPLLMVLAYVPTVLARPGRAVDDSDAFRDEVILCMRAIAMMVLCGVAFCLNIVLLPRQRYDAVVHVGANHSVATALISLFFVQLFSVGFFWMYMLGRDGLRQ